MTKQQIKKLIGKRIKIDHFLDIDVISNKGKVKKIKLKKPIFVWIAGVTELQEGIYKPFRMERGVFRQAYMHYTGVVPCLRVIVDTQGNTEFTSICPECRERIRKE
jgi:hypothetical protein